MEDANQSEQAGPPPGGQYPPIAPGPIPPKRPRGLPGPVLWVLLVLVVAAIAVGQHWAATQPQGASAQPATQGPTPILRFQAQHAVGTKVAGGALGQQGLDPSSRARLVKQFEQIEDPPLQAVRAAVVVGEFVGAEAAVEKLHAIQARQALPGPLAQDVDALTQLYIQGPDALDAATRQRLLDRHGWFGQLALAYNQPTNDPVREAALAAAGVRFQRVVATFLIGAAVLLGALVLCILAVILVAVGTVRSGYRASLAAEAPPSHLPVEATREPWELVEAEAPEPEPEGKAAQRHPAWLETVLLFLIGLPALAVGGAVLSHVIQMEISRWLLWLALLIAFWPVVRGIPWPGVKQGLGWHRGRGVVWEVGAGIIGYLAGLPIVVVGALLTLLLGWAAGGGGPVQHPAVHEVLGGGTWQIVTIYILACIWAPVVEEAIFRGAFYHYLRGWLPSVVAALVVGFIFAIIHPQGWLAAPLLTSLAFVLAMLREWRGSLLAPMTAHALNNFLAITAMLVLMG